MENVRNYQSIKLHLTKSSCLKAIKRPTFKRSIILNENMVLTSHCQEKIMLDKPILVGQTILDLSKCHMYKFWYEVLLKHVNYKKISLLFSDTGKSNYDSFFTWKHVQSLLCYHFISNFLISNSQLNND